MSFNTPILLLTFSRLDTTMRVFEKIKEQKPKYLFWASDGPRSHRLDDIQKIELVKKYIWEQIDWDCNVKTLFREENMGCGLGVSTAITWFFNNVEQGIILEDDCVPFPDFFKFCEDNLNFYKDDERIWEISGTNLQGGIKRGDASYYFSKYGGIWGWATWARAWKNYDFYMKNYDNFLQERKIEKIFSDKSQQKHWIKTFDDAKGVDTWDYQWLFARWYHDGLSIVPNTNLIYNIGFNKEGTHTIIEPHWYESAISGNNTLGQIEHPKELKVDINADDYLFKNSYKSLSVFKRIYLYLKKKF